MDFAALKAQIKADEGIRLHPYADTTGKQSIGYGRNLTDNGIDIDEAEMMLDKDLARIIVAVPMRWAPFSTLDPVRQNVLLNIAYNTGVNGLMLFRHMLAACARGDFVTAAAEIRNSQLAPGRALRLAKQMERGVL